MDGIPAVGLAVPLYISLPVDIIAGKKVSVRRRVNIWKLTVRDAESVVACIGERRSPNRRRYPGATEVAVDNGPTSDEVSGRFDTVAEYDTTG